MKNLLFGLLLTAGSAQAQTAPAPLSTTYIGAPSVVAISDLVVVNLTRSASPTITGITQDKYVVFKICEDSVGGWAWTWPESVHGGNSILLTPRTCSTQAFVSHNGSSLDAQGGVVTESTQ